MFIHLTKYHSPPDKSGDIIINTNQIVFAVADNNHGGTLIILVGSKREIHVRESYESLITFFDAIKPY